MDKLITRSVSFMSFGSGVTVVFRKLFELEDGDLRRDTRSFRKIGNASAARLDRIINQNNHDTTMVNTADGVLYIAFEFATLKLCGGVMLSKVDYINHLAQQHPAEFFNLKA